MVGLDQACVGEIVEILVLWAELEQILVLLAWAVEWEADAGYWDFYFPGYPSETLPNSKVPAVLFLHLLPCQDKPVLRCRLSTHVVEWSLTAIPVR